MNKYKIERWARGHINSEDLESIKPYKHAFNSTDTLEINFQERKGDNFLVRFHTEAESIQGALMKFSGFTDDLFSKISLLSSQPIGISNIGNGAMELLYLDENHRKGSIRIPFDTLPAVSLRVSGYGEYLDELDFPVPDIYKPSLSMFRLSITSTIPECLLFMYAAIESLISPRDLTPSCACGESFYCIKCKRIYTYHGKSRNDLKQIMDEMEIAPEIKDMFFSLRDRFTHGVISISEGLDIVNRAIRKKPMSLYDETGLKLRAFLLAKIVGKSISRYNFIQNFSVNFSYSQKDISDADFSLMHIHSKKDLDMLEENHKIAIGQINENY